MYTDADLNAAERLLKARKTKLFIPLAILLAGFAAMVILGKKWAMLAFLLAAFVYAVFYADLYLLPAVRYRRFLLQIGEGLRRETEAEIVEIEDREQMQDGASVRPLHVRLTDGSERLFWINVRKQAQIPAPGTRVRLQSCGRHVTAVERISD